MSDCFLNSLGCARAWAHARQDLSARRGTHARNTHTHQAKRGRTAGEEKTPVKRETKRKRRAMTHTVTRTRSPMAHTEVT